MSWFKLLESDPTHAAQQDKEWFSAFTAELGADAVAILPFLTQSAVVAESLSGNGALVPITQAAGAGAQQVASALAAHKTAAESLQVAINGASNAAAAGNMADVVSELQNVQTHLNTINAVAASISGH